MVRALFLIIGLVLASLAPLDSATQRPEVDVDTTGAAFVIRIWHPQFETMCRRFAEQLEVPSETNFISVAPKKLPPSRDRYMGDLWIVAADNGRSMEIKNFDLPDVLQKIRGLDTMKVHEGRCQLVDEGRFSPEHFKILTRERDEAHQLGDLIRLVM